MLKAENIQFSFPQSSPVVRGLSIRIESSEIVAIVGRTGAGKTSLLKCLGGHYDIDKGKIWLDDERVMGPDYNLLPGHPRIKHVAQDFNLLRNHTVFENVIADLHQYYKYEKKEIGTKLLRALNIYPLRNTLPRLLSGGQQQRVALAKALAEKPDFLLLDEPFNQQDSWNKNEVLDAIKNWAKAEEIGIVMVTHQFEDALAIADRIVVMEKGKIVQQGTPQDVYFEPKNEQVAELFGTYIIVNDTIVRPTQLKRKKGGSIQAKVVGNRFMGNRYEVVFKYNDQTFTLIHTRPIKVGSTLELEV